MKKLVLAAAAACCAWGPIAARAADDTIRKTNGEQVKAPVQSVSKDGVTFEKGSKQETLKPFEVAAIRFSDAPATMISIIAQVINGGYENALRSLGGIDPGTLERAESKQELQYLKAYCNGRLALGGSVDVNEAGKQLREFVKACPDSYHYYPANELLGDLAAAAGKYDAAATFYKVLADSPFDEYKTRAGVAIGRARLAEKKFPEALKEFETALSLAEKGSGPAADAAKQSALIGKAACLAETGKPEEGLKVIDEVLAKLSPEEVDLHAQAYVAQGNCYRKMPEHAKQALISFLHVDVLYFSNAQAHAEALWNLTALWIENGKQERAVQASELLKQRYPNSPWAKL
ncbi:MAG TPA: tetratricopeptide repeat protein [Pirellulales bacterium]|nr:tetratricopeptide repeat protein [Pirellulales bacterium]